MNRWLIEEILVAKKEVDLFPQWKLDIFKYKNDLNRVSFDREH